MQNLLRIDYEKIPLIASFIQRRDYPYEITFIGSQSALKKQDTQERRSVTASTVLQTLTQLKDVGFDKKASSNFMRRQMNMDKDDAKIYAQELAKLSTLNRQLND